MIWGAAGSYCLENKKPGNFVCDPLILTNYMKPARVPRCPLGNADYASFDVNVGPKCPNCPEVHTGQRYLMIQAPTLAGQTAYVAGVIQSTTKHFEGRLRPVR
jgi:hypothetical protein